MTTCESSLPEISAQLDDLYEAIRGWFCAIMEQHPINTKGTTVTDQTVPVPVDLLQRLRDRYPDSAAISNGPIGELAALIPIPPKVGDVLTADQIRGLPPKSIIRDEDNDVWVTMQGNATLVTHLGRVADHGGNADELANYTPVLVSLPSV